MLVSMEGDFEDICPDDYGRRKNLAGILIPTRSGMAFDVLCKVCTAFWRLRRGG